ncbi:hypothetical protein ACVME8_004688 [Bradyrhizobium diazoefficiens]
MPPSHRSPRGCVNVPLRGPDSAGFGIDDADDFADADEIEDHAAVFEDAGPAAFDNARGRVVTVVHVGRLEHIKNIRKSRRRLICGREQDCEDRMVYQQISRDPAEGFRRTRLPTGWFSWTLTTQLSELLAEAEARFGPRDPTWTPLGIEFDGDVPHIWYPGNRRHVSVVLTELARQDVKRALFQLSHETIHLLSPTGGAEAPVIEEGLATMFSNQISARYGLGFSYDVQSYVTAANLTEALLAMYPDGIKRARERETSFTKFTPQLIQETCPNVPSEMAARLCQPFVRG